MLYHPKPDAPTCIMADASDKAVGAVLQQRSEEDWFPISYFSRKLTPAETRYSAFDRKLLAIYLAIRHFRHFVEGRQFHVLTDHKPLAYALSSDSAGYTPRQVHHLDYISQFTSDIRHVKGVHNAAADAHRDQGRQFESVLWTELMHLLGSSRLRTTAYHRMANGLVERFHRQLKSSLKACHTPTHWVDALPIILLGIRTALKQDLGCSAAELVYGTTLCIPGEFFSIADSTAEDPGSYVVQLKATMQKLRAIEPREKHGYKTYVSDDLMSATHAFVRHDAVRKPLQQPYNGPFKVLHRSDKHFTLDINGRSEVISLDRLKPAYMDVGEKGFSNIQCFPSTGSNVLPAHSNHPFWSSYILQNQGTGVAASVGGTAPLSGAGALIVDAISQSCHVDGLATCSVSVLGAEGTNVQDEKSFISVYEEQATHCYKASGKSNSSSVSAKPPMSPGRVKTLEECIEKSLDQLQWLQVKIK
ncbi:hypothetical protein EMCRGX_G023615 [Ephydatia muelleri]